MDIKTAYDLFLIDHESYCSGRTIEYYQENIPKFFSYLEDLFDLHAADIVCSDLTREIVLGFQKYLRDSGRKNTTINTYFRAVKVFLNYCIDEGYCSPDVLRKVKFLKSDKDPVIPLTECKGYAIPTPFS